VERKIFGRKMKRELTLKEATKILEHKPWLNAEF